ncbi:DUF7501 family protein [Halopelagius longus]|uniref:Uncharacterized protein n=1 Tax=Halopelagius longus TaxID=1236180 RepID=A0A1H1BBK7_9EURY|nr:hypothetical protein [Halopelagius longus]RDI70720.1 hypothetical protein DWB78_02690 [Halopelagius longus]SDQ49260.1 hypothetical protein SAMN05216278_1724 [Halopelagius longus]
MSEPEPPSVLAYTWDDPSVCPFCMAELENPGEGFMTHLQESSVCERGFEEWRSSVTNDIGGEWSG